MHRFPGLGQVNAVLIGLYFIPLWGREAVRSLTSSVYGLDERANMAAAVFYRRAFDLGHDSLSRIATMLSGLKLVMAAMFVALIIDASRGIAVGRKEDRITLDLALLLAMAGILTWGIPSYAFGFGGLVRLYATQFLMVAGAVIVTATERAIEPLPQPARWPAVEEATEPGWLEALGFVREASDRERAR